MKRSNIIALSAVLLSSTTSSFADTELDALKDRVLLLENKTAAVNINGELSTTYDSKNSIQLGDMNLTFSHEINSQFNVAITVKRDGETEDNQDQIIFDEGAINYNQGKFTLSVGRIGVPFGTYSTGMISAPLPKAVTDADKGAVDM
jgi:hypothetical protein